jgi:predicted secreted acid phosphatase
MRRLVALLSFAAALVFASPAAAQLAPPPKIILTSIDHVPMVELYDGGGGLPYLGSSTSYNAGDWEKTLRAYQSTGVYDNQIQQVDSVAQSVIDRSAHASARKAARARLARHGHDHGHGNNHREKPAIVLDVDETTLSNYTAIDLDNFTFGTNSVNEATNEIGTAIAATKKLYDDAKARGVAIFFITGRRENTRAHTAHNLETQGFTGYKQLILKPDASTDSTVVYKSNARAGIEQQGYKIIANIGDQYSDLAGGHAQAAFKLANPFYFLP